MSLHFGKLYILFILMWKWELHFISGKFSETVFSKKKKEMFKCSVSFFEFLALPKNLWCVLGLPVMTQWRVECPKQEAFVSPISEGQEFWGKAAADLTVRCMLADGSNDDWTFFLKTSLCGSQTHRERERPAFHEVVYSPDGHKDQGWAGWSWEPEISPGSPAHALRTRFLSHWQGVELDVEQLGHKLGPIKHAGIKGSGFPGSVTMLTPGLEIIENMHCICL